MSLTLRMGKKPLDGCEVDKELSQRFLIGVQMLSVKFLPNLPQNLPDTVDKTSRDSLEFLFALSVLGLSLDPRFVSPKVALQGRDLTRSLCSDMIPKPLAHGDSCGKRLIEETKTRARTIARRNRHMSDHRSSMMGFRELRVSPTSIQTA